MKRRLYIPLKYFLNAGKNFMPKKLNIMWSDIFWQKFLYGRLVCKAAFITEELFRKLKKLDILHCFCQLIS